jgi:hypothetical protein
MNMKMHAHQWRTVVLGIAMLSAGAALAQGGGETFTATASVTSPGAAASAPVTIRIERFVTEPERDAIVAAVRANDHSATRRALEAAEAVGYIDVASSRTPIKYAYARPTGDGRLITVVAAKPIAYLGAGLPGAKPKGEFDLAMVLLMLDSHDAGDGEFMPAVTLKVDENGAVVTSDYSRELIRLTGISKIK